jgi:triacylglycerol lipase
MARATIVLAHGILGFGRFAALPIMPVRYFNGVADHLERQGYNVIEPEVDPVGSVKLRGETLARTLKHLLTEEEVHVIAHSMGGLDARYALALCPELAEFVKTLVTIGTPHLGSPVADAIVERTGPLFGHIPPLLLEPLEAIAGGLEDLTTAKCAEFNADTPDVAAVRHIAVAGDAAKSRQELLLFQLAAAIGNLTGEVNDGVVTRSSALREGYEQLEDWPTDHAGEVGWSLDSIRLPGSELLHIPPPPHLAWFDAIVSML